MSCNRVKSLRPSDEALYLVHSFCMLWSIRWRLPRLLGSKYSERVATRWYRACVMVCWGRGKSIIRNLVCTKEDLDSVKAHYGGRRNWQSACMRSYASRRLLEISLVAIEEVVYCIFGTHQPASCAFWSLFKFTFWHRYLRAAIPGCRPFITCPISVLNP